MRRRTVIWAVFLGGLLIAGSFAMQAQETPLSTHDVEQAIHDNVNEIRDEEGLSELEYDNDLSQIANQHSEDMAANDVFSHTGSDGDDLQDRYREAGYSCRQATGGRQGGGENILQTYYERSVSGGDEYETADELADGITEQWMDSDEHRANILRASYRKQGIGVVVTDSGTVYATQNFC